ncbi:MAG: glycosyltransferase family 2 protein [Pseudobacteriovorax sp.]|nr:glycosyltransferase family 2 protein [Pseudobacteriovorax sp.]
MVHILKYSIKKCLELAIFGRPVRKILFITYKISRKLLIFSEHWSINHPYVQKINRQQNTRPGGADAGMARYYKSLKYVTKELPYRPKFSVIIPVYRVKHSFLKETIKSVETQSYENWEICIVDDASNDNALTGLLNDLVNKLGKSKFRLSFNKINCHISETSNLAVGMATGDYIVLLDHDDRLLPNALAEAARYINMNDKPDILYSDESHISENGAIENTYHKPGWSPFMHLSVHYTTHLSVFRLDLVNSIGGFRKGFEGSQDHDLMLRAVEKTSKPVVHIPLCLYQWRAHAGSTARSSQAKPYAAVAGEKAVREACERRGRPAEVTFEPQTLHYRIKFNILAPNELVSIIIPSKDSLHLIKPCIESILKKTSYPNYEIVIVDHDSQDNQVKRYYEDLKSRLGEKLKFVLYSEHFNFARMNNLGVNASSGKYVLLLNNDTEVIEPNWLTEMVSLAQFPEVGAVGPKLLYPNKRIQHAGIVGYGYHIAGHSGFDEKRNTDSYYQYHQTMHETLGVTGACILIDKDKYLEIGGLEELYLPNGFGDVDFCLRLRKKGYSNIYTPYAELYHKESPTRKTCFELFERHYILQKWGQQLLNDPYSNPCLDKTPHYKAHPNYKTQQPSGLFYDAILNGDSNWSDL